MGANYLLLNMNVGAMAYEVFLEQIRRFGKDVLPRLQAHQVKRVPAAELATCLGRAPDGSPRLESPLPPAQSAPRGNAQTGP